MFDEIASIDQVDNPVTLESEIIGDERTVTLARIDLGTHDHGTKPKGKVEQEFDTGSEGSRLHVVGIGHFVWSLQTPVPVDVHGGAFAQVLATEVIDDLHIVEHWPEIGFVKPERILLTIGVGANIDQGLRINISKDFDEGFQRHGAVANGIDCLPPGIHEFGPLRNEKNDASTLQCPDCLLGSQRPKGRRPHPRGTLRSMDCPKGFSVPRLLTHGP